MSNSPNETWKAEPIDPKRIDQIYMELSAMQVDLDEDPLAFGPKRLNSKIANVRTHLSRCERIFTQLSQELYMQQRAFRNAKLRFEIKKDDMFVNDPEVRAGRNIADREAAVKVKLRALADEMFTLESNISDLDATLNIVRAKRADLKDVQGRLRDQFKVCLEEKELGAHWGSKLPKGEKSEWEPGRGRATSVDAEEVDDLISAMDKAETQALTPVADDEPVKDDSAADLDLPVSSETLTSSSLPASDIDDILSEINPATPVESAPQVSASAVDSEMDLDALLDNFNG